MANGSALRWGYTRVEHAIQSLGAVDAIAVADAWIDTTQVEGFRISRIEGLTTHLNFVAGDNVLFGIADANLSAAEIEEALEARPTSDKDEPAMSQAMRDVWPIGVAYSDSDGVDRIAVHTDAKTSGDGGAWVLKPNRTFGAGTGFVWWAYNLDGSNALSAGGQLFTHFAKIFGVWVKS